MAAELPSVDSILLKLCELVKEEYNLPTTAKEDLKHLARVMRCLQACYCSKTPFDDNEKRSVVLNPIREACYVAENIVDVLFLLVPAMCSEPAANPDGFRRFFKNTRDSSPSPHHQLAYIEDLIRFSSEAFYQYVDYSSAVCQGVCRSYKNEKETEPVGIQEPKDVLLNKLADGDDMSKKQRKILSILGIAGLGKTTLARTLYNQLKPQFACAAFVTIKIIKSSMKEVFQEMLFQFSVQHGRSWSDDESCLISEIKEFLQDKRYLVVIDDLWYEEDWHSISRCLPNNDYGSRVISTTRGNDIANLCCSGCDEWIYEIQHLGYLDSKKLFLKHFLSCEVSCSNARTDLFHEILKMCGGTASVIVSVASLLATKVTATKPWQEMINSAYSAWKQMAISLPSGSENITSGFQDLRDILSLTCIHLPGTLKDCLLYLAVHAKNQRIHRTTMLRKWIAEELISEYMRRGHEEVAGWHFDQLIERNFIQLAEYGNYVGEEIYEVNSMMLYVLRQISDRENFVTVLSDVGISKNYGRAVRLSVKCCGSGPSVRTEKMDPYRIRSITIVGPGKFILNDDAMQLRVLDLDGCQDLNNSAMDHICRMLLLKYLSLKHTKVTEIPPQIGKLQNLETLDIRQTEISNLPSEIGRLQKLETLDARQTQVKELPKEVVQLHKLAHLYFGQCSAPGGVKLPVGSDQLKSVKVLGTVDSREWSESAMEEISGLTGVTELEVVLHDQPADKHQNDKLLSSIGKCVNLEYLIIHGDYNPGDDILSVSPSFPKLERLKVAGRFMNVPRWIAQLCNLKKLVIRVCKLDQGDLKILGGLPGLNTLAFALTCIPRKKEVAITNGLPSSTSTDLHPGEETSPACFPSLEVFNFDCRVPWITFEQGAMPRLKQLHLKLYACSVVKSPSGIINLRSLEKIILLCSSQDVSSGSVMKSVTAVRKEASSHENLIKLSVNGDHEVFQSNTRAEETMTGAEIEECY